jgi:hypothetical protein
MNPVKTTRLSVLLLLFAAITGNAQMVTGVWQGKINKQSVEVKIIKNGDSITGTSYYYSSFGSYRRYSIRGYFDEATNQVIWWDDQLIEEKAGGLFGAPGKMPLLSRADFNCPGGGVMLLDGSSNEKNEEIKEGSVHLEKTYKNPHFSDEWDWVINNFTVGTADPYIIDSVSLVAFRPKPDRPQAEPAIAKPSKPAMVFIPAAKKEPARVEPEKPVIVAATPVSIEEKFTARKKKIFTTIPIESDSITLSFYDNAIVDGDSVSLFLNNRLLASHIRLSDKPYNFRIATADLGDKSELTMVAENLGAIPPNTSYMVVMCGDKRYTANLASTEESSAVIRFVQPKSSIK